MYTCTLTKYVCWQNLSVFLTTKKMMHKSHSYPGRYVDIIINIMYKFNILKQCLFIIYFTGLYIQMEQLTNHKNKDDDRVWDYLEVVFSDSQSPMVCDFLPCQEENNLIYWSNVLQRQLQKCINVMTLTQTAVPSSMAETEREFNYF